MNASRLSSCLWTAVFCAVHAAIPGLSDAADDEFTAIVRQRVQDWQPTRDERLLDQVGWASDLVEAQRMAQKHQRPLFVFTYNGSTTRANAMALQRC